MEHSELQGLIRGVSTEITGEKILRHPCPPLETKQLLHVLVKWIQWSCKDDNHHKSPDGSVKFGNILTGKGGRKVSLYVWHHDEQGCPELKMQSMRTIKRRYRALALRPPKKYMLPTLHSFRDTSNDRSGGPCCLVPNSDAVDVVDIANAKLWYSQWFTLWH